VSQSQPSGRSLLSVPQPPRTPSARARRLIFAYQGGPKVILLVGTTFLAIGSLFAVIFAGQIPSDLAIALSGREASGRVVSAELDLSTRVNGRHPTRVLFTYDFDGREHEAESSGLNARLLALVPNESVPIEVAAIHPAWARVSGTTRSWTGYLGLLTLLFPLIGGALPVGAVRSRRRAIRAFTLGTPAQARVVFTGLDTTIRMNGRHPFKVVWQFQVDDRTYEGSVSSMDSFLIEPLTRAAELVILYDPANPRVNTVFLD
jgi:hypothetical protein